MKKLLVVGVTLAALLPNPAAAQSVGGYVMHSYEAYVDWETGHSQEGVYVYKFLNVSRYVNPVGGTQTRAQVGTIRCRLESNGGSFVYVCKDRGRLFSVPNDDFEFDPGLGSAAVSFTKGGTQTKVSWDSVDQRPQPRWQLSGGERSLVASAGASAQAEARGTVFDERVPAHRRVNAGLSRRMETGLVYETGVRSFTVRGHSPGQARDALRLRIAAR